MCNACGFYCCASDVFEGCGCEDCPEIECQVICEICGELGLRELREFRDRFGIPISDDELQETPFYKPPEEYEEADDDDFPLFEE